MTAVDRPDNGQDEGRCTGDGCWYTLPMVDGLVVAHSAPMTLDNCEGSGRPPLASGRAGDGEQRQSVAALLRAHWRTPTSACHCGGVALGEDWAVHVADELLALLDQPNGEAG